MVKLIQPYTKFLLSVYVGSQALGTCPVFASEKAQTENWIFSMGGSQSQYRAELVIKMLNATTGPVSGYLIDPANKKHELRPCRETELNNAASLDPNKMSCSFIFKLGDNIAYNLVTAGLVEENWRFALKGNSQSFLSSGQIYSIPPSGEPGLFSGHLAPGVSKGSGDVNPAAKAFFDRGMGFGEKEDFAAAVEQFSKAIELNPKYSEAYYFRGNAYLDLEQYSEALEDYTHAINLNPKYANAYFNRGATYFDSEEYYKAVYDYTQAINLNPKDTDAWNNRGEAFYALGQYQKALYDYNQTLKLNPDHPKATSNRQKVFLALQTPQQRVNEFYNGLLKNPPVNPQRSGFLTKKLSDALEADEAESRNSGLLGKLDFDPWSDSQMGMTGYQIISTKITEALGTPMASVIVVPTIATLSGPKPGGRVNLALRKDEGVWKIMDVIFLEGSNRPSLLQILQTDP